LVAALYLYANAALYVLFALWCTLAPQRTALSIGYTTLSAGGRSEYLVVYGGLQAGLAVMFWLLAQDPARHRLGIVLSIAVYAPIVLYRCVTLARFWPVPSLTVATAALEALLLVAALSIHFSRH
jgi:hypothetical protein